MSKHPKNEDILLGLALQPDVGELKGGKDHYAFSQNYRGWGKFIAPRYGVKTVASLDCGILGMFDLKIDGDVFSPDKILVIDSCGNFNLFDWSELTDVFFYLFHYIYLQSPNLNWWKVYPDTTLGILTSDTVAAPSLQISADMIVKDGQVLGFTNSTGVWWMSINETIGAITTTHSSSLIYSSSPVMDRGFTTGFGPVIQTPNLTKYRITIDDTGSVVNDPI